MLDISDTVDNDRKCYFSGKYSSPVWHPGLDPLFREYPKRAVYFVIGLALTGMGIIFWQDFRHGGAGLTGDVLAVFSAFFFSLYILIARFHKHEKDFIKYLIIVYGSAALFCGIFAFSSAFSFSGYAAESWLFMVFLALGPNLLGHSALNWSSRHSEI